MSKFKDTVETDWIAGSISRAGVTPKYSSVGVTMFVKDLGDNELIKHELGQIGWVPEGAREGLVAPSNWKDSQGFYEFHYDAPQGTGIFLGWTAQEETTHLPRLRAVFSNWGFKRMKPRLRTLAESM